MFNPMVKTARRMAPMLRRVLLVDPEPAATKLLGEQLRGVCLPEIWSAPSNAKALKLAAKVDPQLIFCVFADGAVDGPAFTRALRRSDLACRQAPVILVAAEAGAEAILAGRDAGAHEVLQRPFAARDVLRRLEAVLLQPRGWVEAVDYVGPDRRRFNSAEYDNPQKRPAEAPTPPSVRIAEALKIIASALAAIDREPRQAVRALLAQTAEIEAAASLASDQRLALANAELHGYLCEAARTGAALDPVETCRRAIALLRYAEREARAAA